MFEKNVYTAVAVFLGLLTYQIAIQVEILRCDTSTCMVYGFLRTKTLS